jgi:hypothetical protein
LDRQQPDKASPIFLVQTCQNTIDRSMLLCHLAIGMPLTDCTGAGMKRLKCCIRHMSLPRSATGIWASISQSVQVIFGQILSWTLSICGE